MGGVDQSILQLYMPLLCNQQPEVRQQAATIFLSTYGEPGLVALRALQTEADPELRAQARQCLQQLASGIAGQRRARGLYIQCLNGLRVSVGERTLQACDWMQRDGGRAGWRKVQGVFAYLVDCGRRGASRAELGAAVWGGAVSAVSLSRTLTALRQTLLHAGDAALVEQALQITRDSVRLAPECYQTDAQLFEQTFQVACQTEAERDLAAAAPLYAQALRLYSGPYLADLVCEGEWLLSRRDHYAGNLVIAAERLAEHAYGQRRYQRCIAFCQRALEADETADEISVWLLRAYAKLNQYSDLALEYRRYLRAATLAPDELAAQRNPVVRAYQSLMVRSSQC